ncbi:MAG: hypothetical protein NT136_03920 [Candidatus Moranbacteria bacterium]|nr:hypothetical protein [Candidatus Moranbacteria bacterium]
MPRLDWKETRSLQSGDSILAISFIDGTVTRIELSGKDNVRVEVGSEEYLIDKNRVIGLSIPIGGHIRGFLIAYAIPDEGATVLYFNDFHPV